MPGVEIVNGSDVMGVPGRRTPDVEAGAAGGSSGPAAPRVASIVCATDAGREGELIFRYIYEAAGCEKPFRRLWISSLTPEAIRKGFDEVQFDYIRFPTDPSASTTVGNAVYARPNTMENRLQAISSFLGLAEAAFKPPGGFVSVDVFGLVCWGEDDLGIGQYLEALAPHVDYVSPMVYPSTFHDGLPTSPPSYSNAPAYPYEIVYLSLKKAMERLKDSNTKIRPWLQYFDDYPWATGRVYTDRDIVAQTKAAADAGVAGWMLWDPFVRYDKGGIAPR